MNHMNRHKLYRNPDPEGFGGGAAPDGAPAGGDAAPATPAFDPSEFETKFSTRLQEETGRIRNEYENKFRDLESRIPKQEAKADAEPSMQDFLTNGEMTPEGWSKYQAAINAFHFKNNLSAWEKTQQDKQAETYTKAEVQKTISAHTQRVQEYKAANPDFNPRETRFDRDVALAIADSQYSPHILHFLQKNPERMAELRQLEDSNIRAAVRYVGRLEAQFEMQSAAVDTKVKTAKTTPTIGAFGTGKSAPKQELTPEKAREIYG